jgi:hypothetical protein
VVDNKIKNCKDLFCNISNSNRDFIDKIKNGGGFNLYFRALTAQILWLTLFYNIGILIIPIKQFLLSNAILAIIIVLLTIVKGIIKDKIPDWVGHHIEGNFFYNCDVAFLNKWIIGMLACIAGLLFMNISNSKLYGDKQ